MENKRSRVRESRTSRRGHVVDCRGRYPLGDRRDLPSAATSDGEFHDMATGNGVSAPRVRGSGGSEVRVSKERQTKSVFCLVRLSDRNANECRVGVYPMVLPARNPVYSLTATSAKGRVYGLKIGLVWWIIGMILAAGYFAFLYRSFAGKVVVDANRHGSGK